jgi:hypothetical protein
MIVMLFAVAVSSRTSGFKYQKTARWYGFK